MRKGLLALTILSGSTLFAEFDDDLFSEFSSGIPSSGAVAYTSTSDSMMRTDTVSASAGRVHYSVYGDMLYWNVYTPENSWLVSYTDIAGQAGADSSGNAYTYKDVTFDWNFGFRVGAAFQTSWEKLIFDLNWVRFYTKGHSSFFDSAVEQSDSLSEGAYAYLFDRTNFTTQGSFYSANLDADMHLNQVDLTVKKALCMMDNQLCLLPFAGYRLTFMKYSTEAEFISNQYGDTFTETFPKNTLEITQRNKIFGQGLLVGMKGDVKLGQGFKFYAGLDGALIVGKDKSYRQENFISPDVPSDQGYTKNQTKFRAIADLETGFIWEHLFSNNSWGLRFKTAYEAHMYFDTPSLVYSSSPQPNLTTTFHGLTVGGSIQF